MTSCLNPRYTSGGSSRARRFLVETDDGTLCRLAIISREGDQPEDLTVSLEMDGLIGSREAVASLLERIHVLYPQSEFAPGRKGAS